ncbi:TPA: hypothetical protein ACOJO8_005026 [Vibrio harveyi]
MRRLRYCVAHPLTGRYSAEWIIYTETFILELSSFQSLLQFFAAIYLAVEWVSLDRLIFHYRNKQKKELSFRLRLVKSYSKELEEFWSELQDDKFKLINTYDLDKRYLFFRRTCLAFFLLSFFGLAIATFYGDIEIELIYAYFGFAFFCLPLVYVILRLVLPIKREFKLNKEVILKILVPLELAAKEFRENNKYPQRMDALRKRKQGDVNAMGEHRRKQKEYNERYDDHMRKSL